MKSLLLTPILFLTLLLPLTLTSLPALAGELLLFAAASTQVPLKQAVALFEEQEGERVRLTFASSGTLARQIEGGAPAALFLSANPKWMDHLHGKGLLSPQGKTDLLGNRLTLIAPKGSPLAGDWPQALPRLLKEGRLSLADPGHAPAGQYAKQSLTNLGLWEELKGRLALAQTVRLALAWVQRGESPLGIVYRTDAKNAPEVTPLYEFDPSSHQPIRYQLALIGQPSGRANEQAKRLYHFLRSKKAMKIFQDYGFEAP